MRGGASNPRGREQPPLHSSSSRVGVSDVGATSTMVGRTSMVPTTITIAWIGNSLTDFNNLPSMFQNLSLHLPQPVDVQYRAVMPGGAALFDHANLSLPVGVETADMLSGPWDYVVLQDQSQTPGGGRNEDCGRWARRKRGQSVHWSISTRRASTPRRSCTRRGGTTRATRTTATSTRISRR